MCDGARESSKNAHACDFRAGFDRFEVECYASSHNSVVAASSVQKIPGAPTSAVTQSPPKSQTPGF